MKACTFRQEHDQVDANKLLKELDLDKKLKALAKQNRVIELESNTTLQESKWVTSLVKGDVLLLMWGFT